MKSLADEVKEVLGLSLEPMSIREICCAMKDKYKSAQISASIIYWEKRALLLVKNWKDTKN